MMRGERFTRAAFAEKASASAAEERSLVAKDFHATLAGSQTSLARDDKRKKNAE
jgi:histone H3/H4